MKGILFTDRLLSKVIKGEKTMTRRIIKTPRGAYGFMVAKNNEGVITGVYGCDANERTEKPNGQEWIIKPRYKVGEIVYLKEACGRISGIMFYRTDYPEGSKMRMEFKGFKNKLFMPASEARYKVQITDVRIERAQEITEEEAIKEGFANIAEFQTAWIKINGFSSWKSNPYVFRYEFKRV